MSDLADYVWMRHQWQRFRRLLAGALIALLAIGVSGLIYLGRSQGNGEPQWLFARAGLMLMLGAGALVGLWLWWRATREIHRLDDLVAEARTEKARLARQGSAAKKKDCPRD